MARNTVEVRRLHLRIPGVSREEAQRLGKDVAHRIAQSLPSAGRREQLGALDIRVSLRPGTPRDQIARLVAESVLEKL